MFLKRIIQNVSRKRKCGEKEERKIRKTVCMQGGSEFVVKEVSRA